MNSDSVLWEAFFIPLAGLFAIGLIIAVVLMPLLIAWQRRRAVGQQIYEDAPATHVVKQGTPTMGGIAFVLAAVAGIAIVMKVAGLNEDGRWYPTLLLVVLAAAVGFIDDYLIVIRRRPLGLRARAKFVLLLLLAVAFVAYQSTHLTHYSEVWFGDRVDLPAWLWWFLSLSAIVGAANAVNLTDGLDGLAAGAAIPTLGVLGLAGDPLLATPVMGACAGFLFYNRYPAKIFMGDTGSLALGALMGGIAVQHGLLLLLPLIGIIFVIEALSVILQVASFQLAGKRIFKMTPFHHHFELSGWKEWKVSALFTTASWVAALVVAVTLLNAHTELDWVP